ncbi:MAG: hypothetical protein KDJ27_17400 [Gammaproteobacteria bacterium]|nr:hypothetical protein [Gammaproteobacteria bacterium]MCB1925490.1 hypothetical protein [Gammaproteobacteria bacterium]
MIQVAARIVIWVIVIALAYVILGPKGFDSSDSDNPFASETPLYLPAAKPPRLRELERRLHDGALGADDAQEYHALLKRHQAAFWQDRGETVEQALADVGNGRRARLQQILIERGLSDDEMRVFFTVLDRDHPRLLDDRD